MTRTSKQGCSGILGLKREKNSQEGGTRIAGIVEKKSMTLLHSANIAEQKLQGSHGEDMKEQIPNTIIRTTNQTEEEATKENIKKGIKTNGINSAYSGKSL